MSPAALTPVALRTVYWDSDRYPSERGRSWDGGRHASVFGDGTRSQFACQWSRYSFWFSTSHDPLL